MARITTRATIEEAPLVDAPSDGVGDGEGESASVSRIVTFAKCLRCDFEWMPRTAKPVKCAGCGTPLWNVPYAVQKPGKPAPTRKGKPRGKPLSSGFDPRRQPRRPVNKAAPENP